MLSSSVWSARRLEQKIQQSNVFLSFCFPSVGRGLANSLTTTIETPPMSPALNRIENNIDIHRFHRETSTGSSPSRTSSDDDFRQCFYQVQNFAAQPPTLTNHFNPRINSSSLSSSSSFKMFNNSTNVCPRCSKTVYSAEEVKAIGKVIDCLQQFLYVNRVKLKLSSLFSSILFSVFPQTLLYLCQLQK